MTLKIKSFKTEATPLNPSDPVYLDGSKWASNRAYLNCDQVGNDKNGGFWNSPFSG